MRLRLFLLTLAVVALALPASASATDEAEWDKYKLESALVSLSDTQAGAHPDFTTDLTLSQTEGHAYANTRDVIVRLPPGVFGNPAAFPKCTTLQFGLSPLNSECPIDSQIGSIDIYIAGAINSAVQDEPIYNMPVSGANTVARFGFYAATYPIFINVRLDSETQTVVAAVEGAPAAAELLFSSAVFWGVPADPAHDRERITPEESFQGNGPAEGRPSNLPETPFMTNPTGCESGRTVTATLRSYQLPGSPSSLTVPFPQITGCGNVEFNPEVSLRPTTTQGSSGTGLDYEAMLPSKGLEVGNLTYGSELMRDEVILPEGMTINPSEATGLGVCSPVDLARETYDSAPNVGCPESSKIGSATATTPVLDRTVEGSLYLAKPYENPFGSLLALYLVLKVPDRGVLVKLSGKVEPDPRTGQLVTTFDDVPQLPVSSFRLHFREGARAPLVTPRTCGPYNGVSNLSPWSAPANPLARVSSFQIESGPEHGACPSGGTPPFEPGFSAYSSDPSAGAFSPFFMELTRRDGDQDLTKFSATLPPGLAGVLAGLSKCSDAAIAQARGRTGQDGGREEQASPSCPAGSEIGRVYAGAGVGSVLTYVEGHVYLAGPYKGAPLSVVGVVPAVAGPFDVGTVVTRQALRVDPRTAEVKVDGESSDPIPHILRGIPVLVRDIRVEVNRPKFIFNPTSCEPLSVDATAWGGGADVFGSADDAPHPLSEPFRAADCANLGFQPRLSLALKGGTSRGGHPALRATYRPRKGDANLKGVVVRLPHSAFLDQAHIRTICTRVQFAANGGNGGGCPKGSIYGYAKAYTPILDEPLQGPVYLRSSNHNLPDFVATLHGLVDVEAVARIDSVKGGIRATFTNLPDAPLTKVAVNMQGAKKGLIINSKNLCFKPKGNRGRVSFAAQNGSRSLIKPVVRALGCAKAHKRKHRRHHR
ncbi:MAG TPA: hypothetical protein VK471_05425 [Solirubrobacterales bacterium]|nr:hypothetical protein [Solirubrobacterales bacterium]